jgi:hypothetical protein
MASRKKKPFSDMPRRDDEEHRVGYKSTPLDTRWKPGESGNPSGRPKGARNKKRTPASESLEDIILAEAYRTIQVNDGDRRVSMSMAQAIIRALAVSAAKGNIRSQTLFSEMLNITEGKKLRERQALFEAAVEYKNGWEQELERRRQKGISGPAPFPHPDHIVLNFDTGTVRIVGPLTKEEKVDWDQLVLDKKDLEIEAAELAESLASPDCVDREKLEREFERVEEAIARIERVVG